MSIISLMTGKCVKFVPRTTEDDYIMFVRGIQCMSSIGRIGKRQEIALAPSCLKHHGDVQHEIMHALGFLHEQSRADRDNYVIIIDENIAEGAKNQFAKYEAGNTYGLPYDYESIMHYPFNAFAKNNEMPTVVPKARRSRTGQHDNLSPLDVARIHRRFGCRAAAASSFTGLLNIQIPSVSPLPATTETSSTDSSITTLTYTATERSERRIAAVWLSRNARTWKPINSATVYATLRDASHLPFDSQTAITNSFGEFTLSLPVGGSYTITFEMHGFFPIFLQGFQSDLQLDGKSTMEPLLWINNTFAGNGTAQGNLRYMQSDSYDDFTYAPSVIVNIRNGLNNVSGPILATARTDSIGHWSQDLPSGYYTASVSATGHMPKVFPVVVWGGGGLGTLQSLMPDVSYDDIRIILFSARHNYMQLVVEGPLQDSQQRTRVECQGTKSSADKLIRNDYCGQWADSTVISKQLPGTYRISVYYYDRYGVTSWRLANSLSVVELHRGKNLWARYYVPNRPGDTWNVAEFNGLNITTINEITTLEHNIYG
ncbi:uncharacterized protein LOC129586092 [Paramacrobiotus metropolitanus]|uniref:uncharacterized protein LOC129586092 n=1 Tax=Paramacrobiotus metropolitanus TaxID=2943436 RepID=UPI0024461DD7|nr:uncharacterized protein LOC129586092 [Paramacrobiotus metropolitanus]XP_055335075.1 uncharacterized protein LOC129586092 [Paramacrobiotus metropolitanus]